MNREKLELAAKVMGVELTWRNGCAYYFPNSTNFLPFNPYTDHGDRYRLARACKMRIDFNKGIARYYVDGFHLWTNFTPGDDASEADAIVSAAAEIGRAMK